MARFEAATPMTEDFAYGPGDEVVFKVGPRSPNGVGKILRKAKANVLIEKLDGSTRRVHWQDVISLTTRAMDAATAVPTEQTETDPAPEMAPEIASLTLELPGEAASA